MNNKHIYKLKNTLIFLILVILIDGSCKNISRKDHSFTVKEYQAIGMPDIDTIWTYPYLIKAHGTLATVRNKNFFNLPRKESNKSAKVFRCIICKDNLYFLNDTTISRRDKALLIQSFSSFLSDVTLMYTDNLKVKQYYSEELIELYIYNLYIRKKMFELGEEIMNSKKPEDIDLQQGRKGISNGYLYLIEFLILEQQKTKSFSTRQLNRLNREVVHSISENILYLDSESKQKLSDEIKKITEGSSSGSKRKHLNKILKLISG